jgi:very-short-patch-repair endonuclease
MPSTRFNEGVGTTARARQLRRDATPAERKLWLSIRAGALDGRKFRRQQRVGPFFADFVCQSARLVIEVDGETHAGADAADYDARRTAFLEREGYTVIRFSNGDVMRNLDGVLSAIRSACLLTTPSPSHAASPRGPLPLPQGERSL